MERRRYFDIASFAVALLLVPLVLLASGCSAYNRSGAAPAIASTPQDTPTPVSAPQPNSNGAMARANTQGTGVYVTKGVRQLTGPRWSLEVTDSGEITGPAVHGSTVYFNQGDKLHAVDAATGTKKWDRTLGVEGAASVPAVAGDTVYVGGWEVLYALSAETGGTKWTFQAEQKSDYYLQDPMAVDGTVYFGGEGNFHSNFYAVDSETGQEKWKIKLSGTTGSVPTVYDGIVYIGTFNVDNTTDVYLYALDSKTGQEKWKIKAKGRGIKGAVAVTDGVAYVSTIADGLLALDAKSGQEKWRYEAGTTLVHAPAVAYETVYIRENGVLYAVDAQTGKEKWRLQESDGFTSDPVITDGIIYFTSTEDNHGQPSGGLHAVDAQSGQKLWDFSAPAPGVTSSAPAVSDGTVYFGSEEGTFYAIH